jgi:uncharacterized protein (DUF885 family)
MLGRRRAGPSEDDTMDDRDRQAREVIDRYWDDLLELEPMLGTEVGDERFDDRLPDPGEEGRARREMVQRGALTAIQGIERSALDETTRTTLDVMEAIAKRDLDQLEYRMDRFHAVIHLWGPPGLLAELGSLQRADTPERRERYLLRLQAVPAYLDEIGRIAEEGAQAGQTVPDVVADRTIAQVERLVAGDPAGSPALTPLEGASDDVRQRFVDVLSDDVHPAYGRYLDVLRDYRRSARSSLGLTSLDRGEEMYAAEIRAWTSLDLAAADIHRTGLEDLERIQGERRQAAERLGFPDAPAALAEHDDSGRNRAHSREEMLHLAEEQVRRGWDAAPGMFGRLPKANCEVRPVEEFREADMPGAWYQSPNADGSRPGIYYINTSDLDGRPLHHVATTTYHEANPGHHFQVSLEQEVDGRPALRRFAGILAGSAFIEGWGLYSERLADEMGLFVDEYERLGMLEAQAWRAARLVVDTGIHAFGWERDRAIAKLEDAGVSPVDAVIETDRYIALPGQALSYKLGQLEIERWRAEAAERQGSAFDLKAFHDRLMQLGSLPLPALDRELNG